MGYILEQGKMGYILEQGTKNIRYAPGYHLLLRFLCIDLWCIHTLIIKITKKVSNTFILKLNTPFFSVKGVITP